MNSTVKLLGFLTSYLLVSCNGNPDYERKTHDYMSEGVVPDKITATKIAEAVLPPIYGQGILKHKPFLVTLVNDSLWIVEGSPKKDMDGGSFHLEIKKKDGAIIKVTHGK